MIKKVINLLKTVKYGTIIRDETRELYLRDHPVEPSVKKCPPKR